MKILNWKSISKVKTLNSNSLSAKFISIIGNSKAIIDIGQLRIRSCENAVLNPQFRLLPDFDHSPLPPPLTFFLRSVYWGEYFPKSAIFFFLTTKNHPRRDRPTGLPLFANIVSLPLEFGSHGKMRLTSLHDCYSSWHFYICRSLVRSLDLFDASLLSVTGGGGGGGT